MGYAYILRIYVVYLFFLFSLQKENIVNLRVYLLKTVYYNQ